MDVVPGPGFRQLVEQWAFEASPRPANSSRPEAEEHSEVLLPVRVRLVAGAHIGGAVGVVAGRPVVGLWAEFAALDAGAGGGGCAGVLLPGWFGRRWRDGCVHV